MEEDKVKLKESITLRGVCSALQAMKFPTIQNLVDMLKAAGYKTSIHKEKES